MAWFEILWLVAGVLIMAGVSIFVGFRAEEHKLDGEDVINILGATAVAIVAFPFILALGIIIGPFVGLYFLGVYLRNKSTSKV